MNLRQYQIIAINALHSAIQTRDILLLLAATGAGKTVIIVRMIARYFKDHPGRSFLILMHKQELVTQFVNSFAKFTEIDQREIGIACSGYSQQVILDRRITLATVQTLVNRVGEYPGADLVVVDETHRVTIDEDSQYCSLLAMLREYRPAHKVIGVTATAYRLGHGMIYGDRCRPGRINYFPELTHRITYKELVAGDHLMQLSGRIASSDSITADLANVRVSGDYNLSALGEVMSRVVHVQSAVDGFERYGLEHQHVCVFCCTISHCEAVAQAFRDRGYKTVVIHSQLSSIERAANLASWQSGRARIAVSINILVEGFDFPALSCLVFCRPTKSPTLYVQALGRILRKHDGKTEALLIDLTDNTKNFGLDLDNPQFTIPSGMDGEGEAPTKLCPGENDDGTFCGQLVHASLRYCPYCLYEFEVQPATDALVGEMKPVVFSRPPEPFFVTDVFYEMHESKKNGKWLIKVVYMCGLKDVFFEWVCLPDYYEGFAVIKARQWWEDRSDEPFPETCEEFLFSLTR